VIATATGFVGTRQLIHVGKMKCDVPGEAELGLGAFEDPGVDFAPTSRRVGRALRQPGEL
jgi:hypothetical protein